MLRKRNKVLSLLVAFTVLLAFSTGVCGAALPEFPDNVVKVGNDFYSMQSENFNDDHIVQSLSGGAPQEAFFKTGGSWYDVYKCNNDQMGDPDFAQDPGIINTWTAPGTWYKTGLETELINQEPQKPEIVSVSASDAATIIVTFEGIQDEVTITNFSPSPLLEGENTVSFTYGGFDYTCTVTYNAPPPSKAAVEAVVFDNYRHFQVLFNSEVDLASAQDPANYYFEIVEGDAEFRLLRRPDLGDSNQLSKIETNYPSGPSGWWLGTSNLPRHIIANNVKGKTVVDIYLPEDARFTNTKDRRIVPDHERTLFVETANNKKPIDLIKNKSVGVSVRNVKDKSGKFTINTSLDTMKILDEKAPNLRAVVPFYGPKFYSMSDSDLKGLPSTTFTLNSNGEDLMLIFDEPVFDAHGLGTAYNDEEPPNDPMRNLQVSVNGKKAASTLDGDLFGVLTFPGMFFDSTYNQSRLAFLDLEQAVTRIGEPYQTNAIYTVDISGVTDLAGNIQVSSTISFTVKLQDPSNPVVKPVVKDVKQATDNIFRVEFNMPDVTGQFIITNADGEGNDLLCNIPLSNSKGYSYVCVPAGDLINADIPIIPDPWPWYTNGSGQLCYDGQDYIIRDIKVQNVWKLCNRQSQYDVQGDNKEFSEMRIYKDVYAPKIVPAMPEIEYDSRQWDGAVLAVKVADVIPKKVLRDYENPVCPVWYEYDTDKDDFNYNNGYHEIYNWLDENHSLQPELLPIKVSYVDKNGASHEALVSNVDVPDNELPNGITIAPGEAGIYYNPADQLLFIDLKDSSDIGWLSLLDPLNKTLVDGVTYKVEIPAGYFADPQKDLWWSNDWGDDDSAFVRATDAERLFPVNLDEAACCAPFDGEEVLFDVLYVDDGRSYISVGETLPNIPHWIKQQLPLGYPLPVLGYTSVASDVSIGVGEKPYYDAVPQTSKELIWYDEGKDEIVVEFTGTIDVDTLKDPDNYAVDGKTLANYGLSSDDITYRVDNDENGEITNQYAVFTLPQDTVIRDGDFKFYVEEVAHPDGAKMTPVTTTITLLDNTRPVAVDVKVQGQQQIVMIFDEPLAYKDSNDAIGAANNFEVYANGEKINVFMAVLNDPTRVGDWFDGDLDRVITLDLGGELDEDAEVTVQVVFDQNDDILIVDQSKKKNQLNSDLVYDARWN